MSKGRNVGDFWSFAWCIMTLAHYIHSPFWGKGELGCFRFWIYISDGRPPELRQFSGMKNGVGKLMLMSNKVARSDVVTRAKSR